jgi:hypothetical protein
MKMDFFSAIGILTIFPFGATIIGAVFVAMYFNLKTTTSIIAAFLWLTYSIYEYLMYTRVLCSGECNIRIDLLVIYPVLITTSLVAIVLFYRKKRKARPNV